MHDASALVAPLWRAASAQSRAVLPPREADGAGTADAGVQAPAASRAGWQQARVGGAQGLAPQSWLHAARTSGLPPCASQPRGGAPGPPRKRDGGCGGGAGKPPADAAAWSFHPGPPRGAAGPAGRLSSRDSPGASSRSSSRQPRERAVGSGRPEASGKGLAQGVPPLFAAASRGADDAPSAGLPASIHCGDRTGAWPAARRDACGSNSKNRRNCPSPAAAAPSSAPPGRSESRARGSPARTAAQVSAVTQLAGKATQGFALRRNAACTPRIARPHAECALRPAALCDSTAAAAPLARIAPRVPCVWPFREGARRVARRCSAAARRPGHRCRRVRRRSAAQHLQASKGTYRGLMTLGRHAGGVQRSERKKSKKAGEARGQPAKPGEGASVLTRQYLVPMPELSSLRAAGARTHAQRSHKVRQSIA